MAALSLPLPPRYERVLLPVTRGDSESVATVVNPTLLVEVLTNGTEDYDRGEKLEHYRQIPSLKECLLVSHRSPSMEVWRRDSDGTWRRDEAGPGALIRLLSVGCELSVDEIYRTALGANRAGG